MTVNDEAAAYQFMMEPGPPEVVAHVTVPGGHVVELVTRRDGTRGWIDRACLRATAPDFPVHVVVPFTDEAVSAWHEGTLDLANYADYPTRLAAVAAKVDAAEAEVARVQAEGTTWDVRKARKRTNDAKKERIKLIREARERSAMSVTEISEAAKVHRTNVHRILTGKIGGPIDQT